MSSILLFTRVQPKTVSHLGELLESLQAQTYVDFDLVVVVDHANPKLRARVEALLTSDLRFQLFLQPDQSLAASVNAWLEESQDPAPWVALLDADARLYPDALGLVSAAQAGAAPEVQVIYTDEECRNRWGHLSMRRHKAAIDLARLRTQECVGQLAVLRTSWLQGIGGFDLRAAELPGHAVYLKLAETRGAAGFLHLPQITYQRRRDHRSRHAAPQHRPHMTAFDLVAIEKHLQRLHLPLRPYDVNGTVHLRQDWPNYPELLLLVVLGEDHAEGLAILESLDPVALAREYQPLTIEVLSLATEGTTRLDYLRLGETKRLPVHEFPGMSRAAALNQVLLTTPQSRAVVLGAEPVGDLWLRELGQHLMLPGVGWVGPRLVDGARLVQPGVPGYRYAGWDWNTRGSFNHLAVPHQNLGLSPVCFGLDLRFFRDFGGFDVQLPTLFGLAYGIELDAAGRQVLQIPDALALTTATMAPESEEWGRFRSAYGTKRDRFGLINDTTFTG